MEMEYTIAELLLFSPFESYREIYFVPVFNVPKPIISVSNGIY
jgi:hypothetical protein